MLGFATGAGSAGARPARQVEKMRPVPGGVQDCDRCRRRSIAWLLRTLRTGSHASGVLCTWHSFEPLVIGNWPPRDWVKRLVGYLRRDCNIE